VADSDAGLTGRLRKRLEGLETFIKRDLWLHKPESRGRKALYGGLRMAVLTVEGFVRSEVFLLSAALTFQVTFALVPLLVVMLAVFKAVGGLSNVGKGVQEFLVRYITPQADGELVERINGFVSNINAAAIGVVGFAVLLYTSLSLLHTIEKAFNKIWGVKSTRTVLRRFTVYWALLTVSPILLAASLAMSTFVTSHGLYRWLTAHVPFFGAAALVLAPFVLAWVLFTAVYVSIPNTRVRFRAALAGALVSGTAWEAMKSVYFWYNSKVVTTYALYGSLGTIPVFLLWIYLSWIIVLFGAEVAFALQHVGTYRREVGQVRLSAADRERLALLLCVPPVRAFATGAPPPTAEEIAARFDAPVRVVHEILYQLAAQGVLREVVIGHQKDPGYMPARDPATLTARDVVAAVRTYGDPSALPAGREAAAVYGLVDRAEEQVAAALAGVTLRALADAPDVTL
jgi:membrane protein